MNKQITLSIIIPIYNTEIEKLRTCLNSILNTSTINYEVIMIDDGSEKYIKEFCMEFSNLYHQFKYFYRNNAGVSSARNFGMSRASGTYISFVDSDDLIDLSKLNNINIINAEADLIIFDYTKIMNNKKKVERIFPINSGTVSKSMAIEVALSSGKLNTVWSKLFKKSFIENSSVFNSEIKVGEDYLFMLNTLQANPRIYYIKDVLYYYNYSFETGKKRVGKYKSIILDNYYQIYINEIILIKTNFETENEITNLERIATIALIKNTFSASCNAAISKNLDVEFKNMVHVIVNKINSSAVSINNLSKKNIMAFRLLERKLWRTLYIISLAREIYLKYVSSYKL